MRPDGLGKNSKEEACSSGSQICLRHGCHGAISTGGGVGEGISDNWTGSRSIASKVDPETIPSCSQVTTS